MTQCNAQLHECGWLLLRHAMKRPQTPDQVDRIDADDFSIGITRLEGLQRIVVGRITERRDDDGTVDKVVVAVARGQSVVCPETLVSA